MSTGFVPSLVSMLATTSGRDKACRLVQYLMRLLAARTRVKAACSVDKSQLIERATKMENLGSSMAMTRKVLRFGRPIGIGLDLLKNLNEIIDGKVVNLPKAILKALSSISLILYFLFDHYLYIERIGLANNPQRKARFDYFSNLAWLLECIFGVLKNIVEYIEVVKTCSKSEIKKRRKQLAVDTARNLLDIPIALGFIDDKLISSSKMGFLGVITSLIGIYQIWK